MSTEKESRPRLSDIREALEVALRGWWLEGSGQIGPNDALSIAEGLLPLLVQAKGYAQREAWDEGWDARNDDYWSGDRNPYRSPSAPTDGGAQ